LRRLRRRVFQNTKKNMAIFGRVQKVCVLDFDVCNEGVKVFEVTSRSWYRLFGHSPMKVIKTWIWLPWRRRAARERASGEFEKGSLTSLAWRCH
jgi:hypothetical protein